MTAKDATKNITAYVYMEFENIPKQVIESLSIAKEAIKKQIPIKPIERKKLTYDTDLGRCPVCGNGVNTEVAFCNRCGQALEWEEEE